MGTDGRFYIIDTARLFPPAAPSSITRPHEGSPRGTHLYRLLRPELVKLNPVPLSPDAFTRVGHDAAQNVHNREVLEATRRLETEIVPAFATLLDSRYQRSAGGLRQAPLRQQLSSFVSSVSSLDDSAMQTERTDSSQSPDVEYVELYSVIGVV